jgi:hypothetical protein
MNSDCFPVNINRPRFVIQTSCVLCDVETELSFSRSVVNTYFAEQPLASWSKPQRRSSPRRLVEMRWRRVFTAVPWPRRLVAGLSGKSRFRSQVSRCEICGGQSDTEIGFPPSTSVFFSQYHYLSAPHSSSSTWCSYRKDKRDMPGNLTKSSGLSEMGSTEQKSYLTRTAGRRVLVKAVSSGEW